MLIEKLNIIPKNILEDFLKDKAITYSVIANKLNTSIYNVKKSLCEHDMFFGKSYNLICSGCGKQFQSFIKTFLFCSNKCKHKYQRIWNRGLTKDNSSVLMDHSIRMTNKNPGHLGKKREQLLEMILPKSGIKISYNKNSSLEKEWLLQLDNEPGFKNVERCEEILYYIDKAHNKKRKYYPDFIVEWETGLKWLVEVKGIIKGLDLEKFSTALKWCEENGMVFRLITTGMIKNAEWQTTYCHTYKHITPSKEYIGIHHAVVWSIFSKDINRKVGCVVFTKNMEHILCFGYNGDEKNGPNIAKCSKNGNSGFLHAEDNAILKMKSNEDAIMFLTDSPCEICAKRIINCGNIKEVYYLRNYRDLSGIGLLIQHGIPVFKFKLVDFYGREIDENRAYLMLTPPINGEIALDY